VADTSRVSVGTWRDLLGPAHLGASTVLAGGVLLYATNEFLTISLMPSAVADIGGQRFYAWVTTVYLVASVIAATMVHSLLIRLGPRWAYLSGLSVFGAGSLGCAVAPTMELLLVGRTVQGAAGGLLAGLGYAVINTALPSRLCTRASALVSAMWGVGTLVGPSAGGLFAQFGSWRWAFGVLAMAALVVAGVVRSIVPARPRDLPTTGEVAVTVRAPLAPTLTVIALVGLLLVGFYGAYTFITRIGEPAAGLLPGGMSSLLLGFGLASAGGVVVAGRIERPAVGLVGAGAATTLGLLALAGASHAAFGLVTVLLLGVVTGALPPLAQTEILRRAGTAHRDLASALIPVVFNGGIAVGASAASLLVGYAAHTALPVPAAATAAIATVGLALALRRRASPLSSNHGRRSRR